MEAEIASFCERRALLGGTEKSVGQVDRRHRARVATGDGQGERRGGHAGEHHQDPEGDGGAALRSGEELDIAKTDLGKTGAELRATTQGLLKAKANLEESRERVGALETSTAEMSSRLEATTATLATTTRDRDTERSGRLQANLAKATFRMLKNKFQAGRGENAADALVDAEELGGRRRRVPSRHVAPRERFGWRSAEPSSPAGAFRASRRTDGRPRSSRTRRSWRARPTTSCRTRRCSRRSTTPRPWRSRRGLPPRSEKLDKAGCARVFS